ncbi:MAG: efflux RND transporter periplasmic adaptor subunit [Myxococcota bacterium]
MSWFRRVLPYVPALVTMTVVLVLALVFQRELEDWFSGRPFGEGALATPRTIDVGPLRVAYASRPAKAPAGDSLELYLGVGDRDGVLRDDASVEAGDLAVEARGRGQFTLVVPVPEVGARAVTLSIRSGAEQGSVTLRVMGGRSIAVDGDALTGIAWWTCPMHPSVHAPEDGLCPICRMELTPVTHEELTSGTVRVDARRRQLIGVTTAPVVRGDLHLTARATAVVRIPEGAIQAVTSRSGGWVESVAVNATGQVVQAGDVLAEVSSPDLFAAEAEWLAAAGRSPELGLRDMARATRERLRLLGLDDAAVRALGRAGRADGKLALRAPIAGTVIERAAVAGAPAPMDAPLFRIAALDPIWVEARVHELDAGLAEVGAAVQVSVPYLGGQVFDGKVTSVLPVLDPMTRTLTVRVVLPNPDGRLKADMFADVVFDKVLSDRVVVPTDAVIWTGPRRIVFVDLGDGRMKPVEVQVGARGPDGWEVLSGLAVGDEVVTSGHFLLGAESRLRSAMGTW